MVNVDDDGMKMLGMVLIAAVILILLSTCVFNQNANGGMNCPEGTYYLEKFNCCTMDGLTCFVPPSGCNIVPCDDSKICCAPDVCEIQPDKTEKCLPCDEGSTCIPLELPCCQNMFCLNGFCENCLDYPCNTEEDCCDKFECSEQLCKSCDRPCNLEIDCCDGWECTIDKCEDCNRPCDPSTPCCEGDACSTEGKCEGCEEGAYCSIEKPCCEGMECNTDTKQCEKCLDKVCTSNTDCCAGYNCNTITGLCKPGCVGTPCSNPGYPCRDPLCTGDIETCQVCSDESICAPYPADSIVNYVCQSKCMVGGKTGFQCPPDTDCSCCDFDGKCLDEKKSFKCSDVLNCDSCTCLFSYNVSVCDAGSLLCDGKGCFIPQNPSENVVSNYFFKCAGNPGYCTYLIPADALPSGVTNERYEICLTGYRLGSRCVLATSYEKGEDTFGYIFFIPDNIKFGNSIYGPNQVVVSTVPIADIDVCNSLPDDRFSTPYYFEIGE